MSSGLAIPLAEVLADRHRLGSRVIVLAGDVGSGKTTLLAAVYEAFGTAPSFGYQFAGSDTLVAFEQRCYEARLGSGLEVATTARTVLANPSELMHLAVGKDAGARVHLYVHDVSGEIFRNLTSSPGDAAGLSVLASADRIQLLLDGAVLRDLGARDVAVYNLSMLGRAISSSGVLRPEAKIDVAVTKADKFQGDSATEQFAVDATKEICSALSAERVGHVRTICARSERPKETRSLLGVDDLFATWTGVQATAASGTEQR